MEEPTRLELEPSEVAVLHAAARLLAAHIIAKDVTPENEAQMMDQCITQAINLAKTVDRRVSADSEIRGGLSSDQSL